MNTSRGSLGLLGGRDSRARAGLGAFLLVAACALVHPGEVIFAQAGTGPPPVLASPNFDPYMLSTSRTSSGCAATDDGTVFVMFHGSTPSVGVVDLVTGRLVGALSPDVGTTSGGTVVGRKLYVVGSTAVAVVDVETLETTALFPQIPVDEGGTLWGRAASSPAGDRVYTVQGLSDRMLAIDVRTDTLIGSTSVGPGATGIAVSPDGRRIYVSDFTHGNLTLISATDLRVLGVKSFTCHPGQMQQEPTAVAVAPDGLVYVAYVDDAASRISVLNRDGDVIGCRALAGFSNGLDISKDGRFLVTGNATVIDRASLSDAFQVPSGLGAHQVDFSLDGRRVFVTHLYSPFVSVIEGFPLSARVDVQSGAFNPRSRQPIQAAILSTSNLDATSVDPTTVRLGATGTEVAPVRFTLDDANGDGSTDMILHFEPRLMGLSCKSTHVVLRGEAFGAEIAGWDLITTTGCGVGPLPGRPVLMRDPAELAETPK